MSFITAMVLIDKCITNPLCFYLPSSSLFSVVPPCTGSRNMAMCVQNSFSRRLLLKQFSALPLIYLLTSQEEGPHHNPRIDDTHVYYITKTLRDHCSSFLSTIAPLSENALLWRGHTHTYTNLTLSSPKSDLVDHHTYGKEGAAFFRALDTLMLEQFCKTDFVPRPRSSHVGTGSRATAAEWGVPLTIWPCGAIRYAVREHGGLIYANGDSVASAQVHRGSLVYTGLRDALQHGDEVMFQCHSFYILPSHLLSHVVAMLQSQSP